MRAPNLRRVIQFFEDQLLYVAREWLTLTTLVEQFNAACNSRAPLGGPI